MSDASLDIEPIPVLLAQAIQRLIDGWPEGQFSAKITFEMTRAQWLDLYDALTRESDDGFDAALENANAQDARAEAREAKTNAL